MKEGVLYRSARVCLLSVSLDFDMGLGWAEPGWT